MMKTQGNLVGELSLSFCVYICKSLNLVQVTVTSFLPCQNTSFSHFGPLVLIIDLNFICTSPNSYFSTQMKHYLSTKIPSQQPRNKVSSPCNIYASTLLLAFELSQVWAIIMHGIIFFKSVLELYFLNQYSSLDSTLHKVMYNIQRYDLGPLYDAWYIAGSQ